MPRIQENSTKERSDGRHITARFSRAQKVPAPDVAQARGKPAPADGGQQRAGCV